MSLITSPRFLPLFITQFLGAFNDNLLKNALVILITYRLTANTDQNIQLLVTIAMGLFILPFFLFSALAGQIADKYERSQIVRLIKIAEILIMLCASLGFILQSAWFLIATLFLSGVHSTFFGPIKYALLPQHLKTKELLSGNAYIEAGTFLAILLGTICGGLTIMHDNGIFLIIIALLGLAVLGYLSSRFIPLAPAPDPKLKINYNFWQQTVKIINYSRRSKDVFRCILAISWFWLIGATFLAQFPIYVKHQLQADPSVVTLFLTIFTAGIGIGSFISNKLLKGAIKSTYVFMATIVMSIFIVDLYFASSNDNYTNLSGLLSFERFTHMWSSWRIILDTLLIAISGGIYIVPLYAIMQNKSTSQYMGRIIAANNVINALFMVMSVLISLLLLALSFTTAGIFLTIGLLNFLVALWLKDLKLDR